MNPRDPNARKIHFGKGGKNRNPTQGIIGFFDIKFD